MKTRRRRRIHRSNLNSSREYEFQRNKQHSSERNHRQSTNMRTSKQRDSLHNTMLKFKRKQRVSLNARAKDKQIRDYMFLKHESPKTTKFVKFHETITEKATDLEGECIILEETPEIIVIEDDDNQTDGSKRENRFNEMMKETANNSEIISVEKYSRKRKKIIVKFPLKQPSFSNELPATWQQEAVNYVEDRLGTNETQFNEYNNQESQIISNTDKQDSNVNTAQGSVANGKINQSEDSMFEHYEELIKNENKNEDSVLFFEDSTANTRIKDIEIPLYNVTPNKNIFITAGSEDVVFVSSTPMEKRKKKRKKHSVDDSVIFVSEEPASVPTPFATSDYLSLESNDQPLPLRVRQLQHNEGPPLKKSKRKSQIPGIPLTPDNKSGKATVLFTASEKKKLAKYNSNTYNPNAEVPTPGKRMIILDGCNIGYGHACGNVFSVKGLQIAIEYFEKMGHEVKAVVPQNRLKKWKSSEPEKLETLHREGKIVFTPCKQLPGKSSASYDDRFILQLAAEFDAAIVSNDNYRDLVHENPAFKKIIEHRVIGYTWCNDLFMLPKDPYGRNGPSLSVILNRV